ncbi:MAG: AgmX/PglI C-terminal domain-containing protein, partial [Myxococcota bacterium]|nr:AgmX/PglI C-terminal domain-containing protein [Myxococcota bacterium]
QVRWCYQRELRANPKLEGKVVVKFVIDASGGVSRATVHASSLGNPIVENCICERFMAFQFPKPKGGGMVIVTYPFYFHST